MGRTSDKMPATIRSWLLRYGMAVVCAAVAILIRLLLNPVLGSDLPFITLFPAIAVVVWYGGYRPALLAVLLGCLGAHYFFLLAPGAHVVKVMPEVVALLAYLSSAFVIIVLGEAMRRARRRAEVSAQETAQQREQLRTTLTSIGDGVVVTDAQGRVTSLNPVAESLLGWKSPEALGQPLEAVFQIVNEQTRKKVENPVQRVLREGAVVGLANHTVLIARDKSERAIDDSAAPIRDAARAIVGTVLVFRDVTEKRRDERALRDSEERLRSVVNHVVDGILSIDEHGTVATFNPAAERIFGYSAAEVMGQNVRMLMPEPYHGAHDAYLTNYLRTGQAKIIGVGREVEGRRKDGSTFPMDLAVSEFRLGEHRYFTGIVRDITERKQAEEALQRSEAQFRQLADALPQLVWTARPDGYIDYYNERWYEYTGFPRGEYGESSWAPILHPSDVQRCKDTYYGCIKSGNLYQIEYRFKDHATGGYRWFLGRAYPIRNGQDRIVRWFGTCTDIEDTKKAEEALKEADRRKDEFLATLAHELRNPLAPICNALQILKSPCSDEQTFAKVRDMMDRQLTQMVRLVDDLLDVSRITQGKIEMRKERLELAQVVEVALETSRSAIEAMKHQLTVTRTPQPLWVVGDLIRLAQVVSNLLNNSAKYTPAGGHIWLTVEQQGQKALIRVRDNGMGIPAAMLPKVFEMFTQVDRTLERAQGGLGIGLTLVRQLVEMHGGSVEAHSAGPGQGSEFLVRLPVATEELPNQQPKGAASAADTEVGSAKHRILIADDNEDSANSLGMLLTLMGHEVCTVYDGAAAVEAVAAFQPYVILLDIGMPRLNGYDAARLIRDQFRGKNLLLVAMTGWAQEEDQQRSKEAGIDVHMVKPVEPAALERLLAALKPAEQ